MLLYPICYNAILSFNFCIILFSECNVLTDITDGWINMTTGISGDWSYDAVAEFGCDAGYVLSHNLSITCVQNGTSGEWSDVIPYCEPVDCGTNATAPLNGNVTYGNKTTFGHEAFVNCSEGYWLNGSQTLNCTSDGTWSHQSQICNLIGMHINVT